MEIGHFKQQQKCAMIFCFGFLRVPACNAALCRTRALAARGRGRCGTRRAAVLRAAVPRGNKQRATSDERGIAATEWRLATARTTRGH